MRLRKVNPHSIIRPLISAVKADIWLDISQMEAHYLAGGDVGRVVTALISADRAKIELGWREAAAIDLAGRDVLVLERAGEIGSETSSRNSEVIHAGIYYPTGSLKARACVAGDGYVGTVEPRYPNRDGARTRASSRSGSTTS